MKRVSLIVLLLAFFGLASASNGTETVTIKTQIYCDHCLQCESCGDRMTREIPFIKGVKNFEYVEKSMSFVVTYQTEKTTPEKIREEIANIGFDADDVKANPKALAKFDDCCLKK